MIASDFADLYVTRREGDVFDNVAASFKNRLRSFGWAGQVREGPAAPSLLPPMESDCFALVFDPLPSAELMATAAREAQGQGRKARMPYFDAQLGLWCLSGSEYGYFQRGLSVHGVMDTSVSFPGSYFALIPGQPHSSLYFGSPQTFGEQIRHQTLNDRGHVVICERIMIGRRQGYARGGPLRGSSDLADARIGRIVGVTSGMGGVTQLVPGVFHDLDAAQAALEASRETADVLFARIAERISLE